jgi:hypothetical protein
MSNETKVENLNEIITEPELLDLLGIKKSKLADLRSNQHLPFCKISQNARVYLVPDVLEFLTSRRMVLNKGQ